MNRLIIILILSISIHSFGQQAEVKENMRVIVQTPTNKLENSISFYEKLNFKLISKESPVLFSDGKVIIEVNPERFARAGLKLFKSSWLKEIEKIKLLTAPVKLLNGYLIYDASGIAVYLIESDLNLKFSASDSSFSHLGKLAGLTLETANLKASVDLYEALGFNVTMGSADKGFVSLSTPEGFGITIMRPLMCPHLFFNPSLTYFNGKNNSEIISKIRQLNIPITEEIGGFNKTGMVDNIIIRDPGGFGFFLFND